METMLKEKNCDQDHLNLDFSESAREPGTDLKF